MLSPPQASHHFLARFFALGRVLSKASFQNAAPIALPFYFGLLLLASVLFSPQGLEAKTVIQAFQNSPGLALALWAAWILFTLPIARAVLTPKEGALFRALPIPRIHFLFIIGFHLLMIEFPWTLLWLRGSGRQFLNIFPALGAALAAGGAHALLVAQDKSPPSILACLLLLPLCAFSAKYPIVLLAGIPIFMLGLPAAFKRAYERPSFSRNLYFPRKSISAALGLAYLAGIARTNSSVLARAFFTTLLGALIAPFVARGYSLDTPSSLSSLSLGIASAFLFISIDGIAGAILRTENQMRWILDCNSIPGFTRTWAASGSASLLGALLGMLHGALLIYMLRAGIAPRHLKELLINPIYTRNLSLRLILLSCFLGSCIGFIATFNARLSNWDGPKYEGRALIRSLLFIGASTVAWSYLGELTLLPLASTAALSGYFSSRIALKPAPSFQRHTHAR